MRLISCLIQNFGSYEYLEFSFENQDVCLLSGPTGAGKSTVCDIVPWILFGKTAKNGKIDEVLHWGSDYPAKGLLYLENKGKNIEVCRIRGHKANDLYYHVDQGEVQRGKDLNDTQKQINSLLGLDADLFLLGSYFHEFSQSAAFFTTTPKIRRAICDQLVDLTLAKRLKVSLTEAQEVLERQIEHTDNEITKQNQELKFIEVEMIKTQNKGSAFDRDKEAQVNKLDKLNVQFEEIKQEQLKMLETELHNVAEDNRVLIDAEISRLRALEASISDVCSSCGGYLAHKDKNDLQSRISALKQDKTEAVYASQRKSALERDIKDLRTQKNTYAEQIEALKGQKNPFRSIYDDFRSRDERIRERVRRNVEERDGIQRGLLDIEMLLELTVVFRGSLLSNTINRLEESTNKLLEDHFDGEFKIELTVDEEGDQVDIKIIKDCHECSYTQLSKGQRQLVKLCFGVSVMKCISDQHGIKFSTIFIDEALDGLGIDAKLKALSLIQKLKLDYESIIMIDHATEIKSFVDKQYEVTLTNGVSTIYEIR